MKSLSNAQIELCAPYPPAMQAQYDDGSYPDGFWPWIAENWHIYEAAVALARSAKKRGIQRWSARSIIEILRWNSALRERGESAVKINSNSAPGIARLAMAREPDLAGFFETRTPPGRGEAYRLDGSRYAAGAAP